MTDAGSFETIYKPAYDCIVQSGPSVPDAVALVLEIQRHSTHETPALYASTAITSAGFKRDVALEFGEVVRLNNLTSALIMNDLARDGAADVSPANVMLPTELGKVPGWSDSDYLLFYFCWLAGLDDDGAKLVADQMLDPVRAGIVAAANDRTLTNEQRWPSYRVMVEILLTNIAIAEATGGRTHRGARTLVQLVDTKESLGCRAEQMYADARGLDCVAVTLDDSVSEQLRELRERLEALGAEVGVPRRPAQLVPLHLR